MGVAPTENKLREEQLICLGYGTMQAKGCTNME